MTVYDCNYNAPVSDLQCIENILDPEKCHNINDDVNNSILVGINTSTTEPQCTANFSNLEKDNDDKNDDDVNSPIILANNMSGPSLNEQRVDNFENFVIRKLTNFELNINSMRQQLKVINTNQKLILEICHSGQLWM